MKNGIFILLSFALFQLYACDTPNTKSSELTPEDSLLHKEGKTINERFSCPPNFKRSKLDSTSFSYYLRHLSLLPDSIQVKLFDGTLKENQNAHAAIIDMSVGKKDLQQCADAIMRLRAEYLFKIKKYDAIKFHFVNGFLCEYTKWREGNRLKIANNSISWNKTSPMDASYTSFLNYMETVFNYASTLSLSKELTSIELSEVAIGDIFIKAGAPGHAVIVVDICEDTNGNKRVMLAQSYMPAQQIHLLKNLENSKISPWFDLNEFDRIYTPEWVFDKNQLKRFAN
jgi:hypothetical protein